MPVNETIAGSDNCLSPNRCHYVNRFQLYLKFTHFYWRKCIIWNVIWKILSRAECVEHLCGKSLCVWFPNSLVLPSWCRTLSLSSSLVASGTIAMMTMVVLPEMIFTICYILYWLPALILKKSCQLTFKQNTEHSIHENVFQNAVCQILFRPKSVNTCAHWLLAWHLYTDFINWYTDILFTTVLWPPSKLAWFGRGSNLRPLIQ